MPDKNTPKNEDESSIDIDALDAFFAGPIDVGPDTIAEDLLEDTHAEIQSTVETDAKSLEAIENVEFQRLQSALQEIQSKGLATIDVQEAKDPTKRHRHIFLLAQSHLSGSGETSNTDLDDFYQTCQIVHCLKKNGTTLPLLSEGTERGKVTSKIVKDDSKLVIQGEEKLIFGEDMQTMMYENPDGKRVFETLLGAVSANRKSVGAAATVLEDMVATPLALGAESKDITKEIRDTIPQMTEHQRLQEKWGLFSEMNAVLPKRGQPDVCRVNGSAPMTLKEAKQEWDTMLKLENDFDNFNIRREKELGEYIAERQEGGEDITVVTFGRAHADNLIDRFRDSGTVHTILPTSISKKDMENFKNSKNERQRIMQEMPPYLVQWAQKEGFSI
jgi:hypothetical protein